MTDKNNKKLIIYGGEPPTTHEDIELVELMENVMNRMLINAIIENRNKEDVE